MYLLEKICEELGVEVGEIWKGSDGFKYCILSDGNIERYEGEILENYMTLNVVWKDIISGELKPVWKPKIGEEFYIIDLIDEDLYGTTFWSDNEINYKWLDRGLVFKTKEEAIATANKMLNSLKEN